ncbi:MAG: hypothetical protein M3Q88_05665 [Pseudomonadota bacterium]|nr:hypothetical protein [Pseudomonadota bacterium]
MSDNNVLSVHVDRGNGSFIGVRDTILPLFIELDGKGNRRWLISFGHERPITVTLRGAINVSERATPRSSFGL